MADDDKKPFHNPFAALSNLRGTLLAAAYVGIGDGMISVLFSPTLAKIIATLLVAAVLVVKPGGLARSTAT